MKTDELETRGLTENEEAQAIIKGEVTEYWNQEEIEVILHFDRDDKFLIYINDKTSQLGLPSERSEGFKWYFSFYINILDI